MAKMNKEVKAVITKDMEQAKTWEELKAVYVQYIAQFNTKAAVKFIDDAFEACAPGVRDKHVALSTGKKYTKEPEDTADEFKKLIASLLEIDGAVVEIVGTWIWVSNIGPGEANKGKREKLKEFGFHFSKPKKAWGKGPGNKKYYRKGYKSPFKDMDSLRSAYGSHVIEDAEEIA